MREREVRWYIGNTQDSLESMEERIFVLDRIDGPDTNGQVRLVAKDPLSLLDDKRTLAPRQNRGELAGTIDDTDTILTLKPVAIGPTPGIVELEYDLPTPYFIAVGGSEVMKVTSVNVAGNSLTVERGQKNTEAVQHGIDSRIQVALEYDALPPQDILSDLLINYVGSTQKFADFISSNNWDAEVNEFLGGPATIKYTALITEPTPVNDLCNEVCKQAGISLWWDDTLSEIQLQVLRRVVGIETLYDDNIILRNSFSQRENPNKRISQTWIYYAQINPTEREDPNNFREALVNISTLSEEAYGTPSVERIFSRWIPINGFIIAERTSNVILTRYSLPPRTFKFSLLRNEDLEIPLLGVGVTIAPYNLQDDTGDQAVIQAQITEVLPRDATWEVTAEEFTRSDIPFLPPAPNLFVIPIVTNQNNINILTEFNRLYNFDDLTSGDVVRCEVRQNVQIGSGSTSLPSLRTGTGWPNGVELELDIFQGAIIAGKGGAGGSASNPSRSFGQRNNTAVANNGGNGGVGVLVEHPIKITNNGIIGGGGGGGGAAASIEQAEFVFFRIADIAYASAGGGGGGGLGSGGVATSAGAARSGINGAKLTGGATVTASDSSNEAITVNASATSGAGGNLGQPGTTGSASGSTSGASPNFTQRVTGSAGQPGAAVNGDSLVISGDTWPGDIRGSRIN
jgi:hypothetical protein